MTGNKTHYYIITIIIIIMILFNDIHFSTYFHEFHDEIMRRQDQSISRLLQ